MAAESAARRGPSVPDGKATLPLDPFRILGDLPLGVVVCELDPEAGHPLLLANRSARRLFRIDTDGSVPSLEAVPVLEYGEPLLEQFRTATRLRRRRGFEWQFPQDGTMRHLYCDIVPLDAQDGGSPRVLCTLTDRTAERKAASKLLQQALHDQLTGLPNRNYFRTQLDEIVAECRHEEGRHCAVLILNVDRFQRINESFSHEVGDAFLVDLAKSLRNCVGKNETLAHLSGDEFAILMPGLASVEKAVERAREVHAVMATPWIIDGIEAYCSLGIGIATTMTSRPHAENLMRDAHIALHRAKTMGRGRTEVHRSERAVQHGGAIALETALRHAIEKDELELHFQPIVDLETRQAVAFEALARWTHPERGAISPGEFIPLAEDSGLIVPLGRWALLAACRQLKAWQDAHEGLDGLTVNVNLSTVQFLDDDITVAVANALRRSELDPRSLRIEITESALVADPERAAGLLHQIKALGPSLALDDFGTGYSSLSYLSSFPLDCIKIDRSFISRIDRDPPAAKISHMICMLSDMLGTSVVAEGIETESQCAKVRALGCRFGQGFLFSRPQPAHAAAALLPARAVRTVLGAPA